MSELVDMDIKTVIIPIFHFQNNKWKPGRYKKRSKSNFERLNVQCFR